VEFLSKLALVLLTLVGYSSGAVLGARDRRAAPGLLDLAIVLALWVCALATRAQLGKWAAIGVWLVVALIVGAVGEWLRRSAYPGEARRPIPAEVRGPRRWWAAWTGFSRRMGNYQSRVWLSLLYFVVVLPFALVVRLFGAPLRTSASSSQGAWVQREGEATDLDSARSQF
jgi:hypothetical protein